MKQIWVSKNEVKHEPPEIDLTGKFEYYVEFSEYQRVCFILDEVMKDLIHTSPVEQAYGQTHPLGETI